ncbi:UNKNOWN [Stylonychia lemnae]|uniref:Uncharacterized protein n=1 Tax=Stylonychia lemnae TaxID=5949 RepID=A0A078ALY4_STYLE|nr:UNKNOWN [Stylonychia lemnae]|eukprot:CDW82417.1 UNKNOWN [Stylonychia lemnae]
MQRNQNPKSANHYLNMSSLVQLMMIKMAQKAKNDLSRNIFKQDKEISLLEQLIMKQYQSHRELSNIMSNESQNTKNGLATSSRNGDDVDSIKWNSFNTKQQKKTSATLKKLSIKKLNSLLEKNQEFKKRINLPAIDSLKRCQTQTNSELLSNRLFNSSLVGSMLGSDGEMKSGNMLKAQSTRYQIFENEEEESSELLDNFLLDNQDNFSNNLIIGTSSIIGISQPEIKITEQESQDVFNKSTLVNQNSQQNQGFLAIPQKHAQLNTQSTSIKILPPLRKIHDRQKSSGRISQQQCQMNEQNIYNNDFISQNQTSLSQRENSNKYENQATFKKISERLYKLPKMNIIISQAEHTQSN